MVFSLSQAEMETSGNNDPDVTIPQCLWHHWQLSTRNMCHDIGVLEFVWQWSGCFGCLKSYFERHIRH